MSVASRITDLVNAVATAMNARNAPGPSDYQVWLGQGNSGDIAAYRTAMIGSDVDYAAQFASQLGALPAGAGGATEAAAGITQLATLAEVAAGSTTKPFSPGRAPIRFANNLAGLDTIAATNPTPGTIAIVPAFSTNSGTVQPSYWRYTTDSKWQPLIPLRASNTAVPATDLKTVFAAVGSIKMEPNESRCVAFSNGTDPTAGYDEYVWIGATTGFFLWRGELAVVAGSGYNKNNRYNRLRVDGNQTHLSFSIENASGTTAAADALIVQLNTYGAYLGPSQDLLFSGATVIDSGWQPQAFFVRTDGVHILGTPPAKGSGAAASVFGSTTSWPRPLPTA